MNKSTQIPLMFNGRKSFAAMSGEGTPDFSIVNLATL
jgi:hypothetical protein